MAQQKKIYLLTNRNFNSEWWIEVDNEWIVYKRWREKGRKSPREKGRDVSHVHLWVNPNAYNPNSWDERFSDVNEKTLKCEYCGKKAPYTYEQFKFLARLLEL